MNRLFVLLSITIFTISCAPRSLFDEGPSLALENPDSEEACERSFIRDYNEIESKVNEARYESSIEEAFALIETFQENYEGEACMALRETTELPWRISADEVIQSWTEKLDAIAAVIPADVSEEPITD